MRSPDAPAHLSSQPVIRAWLARSCNVHRVESTHTRVRGTRAFFLLPFPAFFAFLLAIMLGCGIARAIRMRNEREQWWRWRKPTLARVALPCIYSDGSMSGRWRRERREKDETRPSHWNGTKPRGNGHSSDGWPSESRLELRTGEFLGPTTRYTSWQREFSPLSRLCCKQRVLYSYAEILPYIYIYIYNFWWSMTNLGNNRRLFARVPIILTPNYLIRVRVRDRPYSTNFSYTMERGESARRRTWRSYRGW